MEAIPGSSKEYRRSVMCAQPTVSQTWSTQRTRRLDWNNHCGSAVNSPKLTYELNTMPNKVPGRFLCDVGADTQIDQWDRIESPATDLYTTV